MFGRSKTERVAASFGWGVKPPRGARIPIGVNPDGSLIWQIEGASEGLGRIYTVSFQGVAISAKQDLFYIKPAADKPCQIEAVYLSNIGVAADAGDAQEELLDLQMLYMPATVTAGSVGTAPTPRPLIVNDSAAGFTARVNDTTVATTSGTRYPLHTDGWNVRVPYVYLPPPEHRAMVANAAAIVFRLAETGSAMADAITCNGTMYVREWP